MSSHSATPALTAASTETPSSPQSDEKGSSHSTGRVSPETIIAHAGPARPTHYLGRGNGKFTPLVALDELPSNIKIDGLALSMTFSEVVQAGGQLCMPAMEMAKDKYVVIQVSDTRNNDASLETSVAKPGISNSIDIPSSGAINARLARALDGVGASTDPEKLKQALLQLKNQKNVSGSQRYNPTTPGVLGQKVYCTHWMRTGECDFTQQGCMFLHAMPDLDTLELLGFRSYPRWFREMPRQYQLQNATDFNEIGLDQHRHSRAMANPENWHNQGNKYMPPRGPMTSGLPTYQQQHFHHMPGSTGTANDASWRNNGFNQPHAPMTYGNMHYQRSYTPISPNMGNAQPYYPAPEAPSIWSRDTSPNMGLVNRLHKPLSPEITSSYPAFANLNMSSNQFNQSPAYVTGHVRSITPGPSQRASNIGNKPINANPKTSTLFKAGNRGRGRDREPRRQDRSSSPQNKSAEKVSETLSTATKTEDQNPAAVNSSEAKN